MDNREKAFTHCATCGGLLNENYYTFTEEGLYGTMFYELDGSDNVFCSKNCACEMLCLLRRANEK